MSSNSTTPPDQSTAGENAFYVGINLQDILYGIELCLYFKTMQVFLTRRKTAHRSDVFYALFSTVMLVLITIWIAVDAFFGQEIWILSGPNYPGGPLAYGAAHASDPYIEVAGAAAVILQLMSDGLLLHRCQIVWDSRRAVIVPCILWLATFVLGILIVWVASIPDKDFYSGFSAQIGMAYYSASIFLTTTLTSLIIYRLVRHAGTVKEYLGHQFASPYFAIIMLLVESVLPYTLSGIALMISYALGSRSESALSRVYTLMMCVSPQMLILRVAEGTAWQKDSVRPPLSVLRFSRGAMSDSERCDESGMEGTHPQTSKSGEDCKV